MWCMLWRFFCLYRVAGKKLTVIKFSDLPSKCISLILMGIIWRIGSLYYSLFWWCKVTNLVIVQILVLMEFYLKQASSTINLSNFHYMVGRTDCQQYSHIKPLLVLRTVGIVLAYVLKLSHVFSVCGGFYPCWPTHTWQQFACLSVSSSWVLLAITISTA